MRHTIKGWLLTTRPWSFPASVMPVVVSLCFLFGVGLQVNWIVGIAAVVNILLFHAAANLWSDLHDFKHGVDTVETIGPKTLTSGEYKPSEIKAFSICLFAIAIILGVTIVCLTSVELLWIGVIGAILALIYPLMKFNALGDLNIFLTFCILPSVGISLIATGEIYWSVIFATIPMGLMIVAILHANNSRDHIHDHEASINTFAMVIGQKASYWVYFLEVVFLPYAWIAVMAGASIYTPVTLACLITLPLANSNNRQFRNMVYNNTGNINDLDVKTAQLQMLLGIIMSIAFIIGKYI